MSDPCHGCGVWFERKAWQIKKWDYHCPSCKRAYTQEWRDRRKSEGRPVIATPKTPEYRAAYDAVYLRKPDVRVRRAANMRRYQSDPRLRQRHEARWQARRAINAGVLVKGPCAVCGSVDVQAHHDDYSKPLDVMWLCRTHHRQRHAAAKGD